MRDAYQVSTVRAAEHALMEIVPDGTLMGRAAAGLASVCASLLARYPGQVYGRRVAVLAGRGDNGGDALYAGARLARRGVAVTAVAAGSRAHPGGAAALRAAGGRMSGDPGTAAAAISRADLIIDGLLGIGGRGGLRDPFAGLARQAARARQAGATVVAVDLPSGIDADTGAVDGPAVRADVTVTFGVIKPGLLIDPAAGHAGAVELVDIGLRPYLTVGGGLVRTEVNGHPAPGLVPKISDGNAGLNGGVGVMGFLSDHVGLRGDVRYFRDFRESPPGTVQFGAFHFWRASLGLVLRP